MLTSFLSPASASTSSTSAPRSKRAPSSAEAAEEATEEEESEEEESEDEESGAGPLKLSGYGNILFSYHDYGPDQTQEGGAAADNRLTFDTVRFALEIEKELGGGFEFEAEIEIEHHGSGGALELEYEEFGEYEQDVELGGEVGLEKLYLAKEFNDWLTVKAGRFYVGVGLLPEIHTPIELLGATRPEAETRITPALWHEIGLSAKFDFEWVELLFQVVNGLDSTGFSSQGWVGTGHQSRFEINRATDLAFVARVDFRAREGLLMGLSAYRGGSSQNRPKPDLEDLSGTVTILDAHAAVDIDGFTLRAAALYGSLGDAEAISAQNRTLSNNLGVLRSPVAEVAYSMWLEAGYDVFRPFLPKTPYALSPYMRVEHFDSMFRAEHTFDVPRFENTVLSAGLNLTHAQSVALKLEYAHRTFGDSDLRAENTGRLSASFAY